MSITITFPAIDFDLIVDEKLDHPIRKSFKNADLAKKYLAELSTALRAKYPNINNAELTKFLNIKILEIDDATKNNDAEPNV